MNLESTIQFLLIRLLAGAAALVIIGWGTKSFIPRLINHYGFEYFGFKRPYQPGYLTGWILASLTLCVLGSVAFFHAPECLPGLALIGVALQGTWRLDRRFQVIPDRLHVLGVLGVVWTLGFSGQYERPDFAHETVMALGMVAALWALSFLYEKFRGRPAMGLGDIKLLAWLAPLLGPGLLTVLFASLLLAAISVLPRLLFKRLGWNGTFAFGPYIVTAACAYAMLPAFPKVLFALGAGGFAIP